MYQKNQNYLKEEAGAGNFIQKSGVYLIKITEARVYTTNTSSAEAIFFKGINDNKEGLFWSHFYQNKEGGEISHNVRLLNHLEYLTGRDSSNFKIIFDNYGNEIIKDFENAVIYAEVQVKEDEKGKKQYNVLTYFHSKTKQTSKEKTENRNAVLFNEAVEKYKKQATEETQENNNVEEFPF